MSEKNILKAIKEMGFTQAEALELLKANQKESLLTREEKEEQAKEENAKAKKAEEKEEKTEKEDGSGEEEKPAPAAPTAADLVIKKLEGIEKKIEKLEKSGKIPGKTPSQGEQKDKDELPDAVSYTIQKNWFETDI
jgi:hypothetical protein